MIINNSKKMMDLMGNSPYDFVMNHSESQLEALENFVHRTFNGQDFVGFIKGLQHIYQNHNGLEKKSKAQIKGISSIADSCLITVQGLGMVGIIGVNYRIFRALAKNGISVFLVSHPKTALP